MLYKNRSHFDSISKSIGKHLSKIGLSPNAWTVLSLIPATVTFYLIYAGMFLESAFMILFTAAFDMIDGAVARHTNSVSKHGAYLDTMVDRLIEAIIIFGLLFAPLSTQYMSLSKWVFVLIFGSVFSTYAKSASAEKGVFSKDLNGIKGGIMEHTDRMFALFLILLFLGVGQSFWASYFLILTAILSNVTAIQRMYLALTASKE